MTRCYNFCAGPAALPDAVLETAAAELTDWHGTGMSIMEMSHRSSDFVAVAEQAEADLRSLLAVPREYAVLFLQGGASTQFAAVPLNLLAGGGAADYVNTGQWSKKAIAEARRYAEVRVVASSEDRNFSYVPPQQSWQCSDDAAYLHYTPNETIGGVEFPWIPETGVPLVADIGPAGLTVVLARRDLLGHADPHCPAMLNWQTMADSDSMYNTPPTFALYLAGLVFRWLLDNGGLDAMAARNRRKADKLYAAIDASGLYANPVEPADRSLMNVPFTLADPGLDALFLQEAESRGLRNLKGHRSVGGMRASIYNAVSEEAVDALIGFMQDFERRHAGA